jgi:hypothetical protein
MKPAAKRIDFIFEPPVSNTFGLKYIWAQSPWILSEKLFDRHLMKESFSALLHPVNPLVAPFSGTRCR